MTALQVRDCPKDIYDSLCAEAREEDRSITQQMLSILRERYGAGFPRAGGARELRYETREERAARKERVLREAQGLGGFAIPAEYGDAAELVARSREERW